MVRKVSDFVLADRQLSGPIAALGAGASDMSGWLLMALPGLLFTFGFSSLWLPLALCAGAFLNWLFISKRLRVYTEILDNSLTIPAYFQHRFAGSKIRMVTSIVIIVFFTAYASANFVMCAQLTEQLFSIDYTRALLISSVIMISYTCLGGFLAVNWIDFFQGTLMLICLLVVPIYSLSHLGSFDEVISKAQAIPYYTDVFKGIDYTKAISLIAWGLGYFGQLHILTRFMAVKNHHDLPLAKNICMSWMGASLVGAVSCGILGRLYYGDLDNAEMVFIKLSQDLFNPWAAAILISAVLSAIMSTITAQILNAASSLVEDFYHRKIRVNASQRELILVGRVSVVLVAIASIYFALNPKGTIFQLVGFAWSGLGASFGPVIIVSLYWQSMTTSAAITGMLVGAITVIVWELLQTQGGIFAINGILPGFIFNLITIYLVSRFTEVNLGTKESFARMLAIVKSVRNDEQKI